jgi:hypothetical protein
MAEFQNYDVNVGTNAELLFVESVILCSVTYL